MPTAAAKKLPTQFTYTIDMDERGEFRATVYGPGGKEVLEVNDETFEDGWMKHKNDLNGLAEYLEHLGIGAKGTRVKKEASRMSNDMNPADIGKKTPPAQMDPNSPYLKDFNQRRWSELSTLYNKGLVADDAMLETKLAKVARAREDLRPLLLPLLKQARDNRLESVDAYLAARHHFKVKAARWNGLTNFEKLALLRRVAHLPTLAPLGLDKDTVRQGRGFMTYKIDRDANNSKFYEGLIVGGGSLGVKVIVRWGALTDSGETGKIEGARFDNDPRYEARNLDGAKKILAKIYKTRMAHGYKDAFGPDHVSPIDGKKLPMGQYPVGLTRQVGFGWGTQSITQCVPALHQLTDQLASALRATSQKEATADIKVKLEATNALLNALTHADSSMASKLKGAIGKVLRRLEGSPRFLPDPDGVQLARELKTIITYITKQTSYCG